MSIAKRIADWLETHWVTPAYSGWLLGGLSLFFFISATNTLAGWLYVISGISFALLSIAAILPERMLRRIQLQRCPIAPVTVGDQLTVELVVANKTKQPKLLIQIQDQLPFVLAPPVSAAIEMIAPHSSYHWVYQQTVERRGIYRWHTVNLRTAAPLGLFWCRRSQTAAAIAVVYPTVLPLTQCPLVDAIGRDASLQFTRDRHAQNASEGLTRSLRPYRWGDPIRFVHWRTSARYGELRVRELETFISGQELIICLDSAMSWQPELDPSHSIEPFEQAVVAAASLYFYATRHNFSVRLWTAGTGLVQGSQAVLETLAAVQAGEDVRAEQLPDAPLLWLTQNPVGLTTLPSGSRWLLWTMAQLEPTVASSPGLLIQPDAPLQLQLQRTVEKQLQAE
ncbi:DUF58 domain-containing protein [Phormidium sp. FACHB-592]|uniref:DUF58 domain-containing protein n=1 Tax=Stenomitos frigidus AS-A4 TaxID=2933935 RepID=A0ABV0KTF2_9CYAN|nr:DUF58 domain-containing protein [Phormidium sp. FACHB-592]MBD2076812.1 DUF58 domain-containing protein [Phormidium sp. FACHB-592]